MATKTKAKQLTILSAIISFLSFGYKMGLGIWTMSLVLMVASISTLLVFICKVIFIRNLTETREKKRQAYLFMTIAALIYAVLFLLFAVLKVNGIDTSNKNTYEGLVGSLLIGVILVMFILSIIKLRGALEKTDLMVIGLKEFTFVSAMADLVIIEEFVSRIVLRYVEVPYMAQINSYFVLGVTAVMLIVPVFMLVRFIRYKP